VTRHGLNHTRAIATALRPMAHLVPDVVNCDPIVAFEHHLSTIDPRASHHSGNNAARWTCQGPGQLIATLRRKSKYP
jgi:hypothetical protein